MGDRERDRVWTDPCGEQQRECPEGEEPIGECGCRLPHAGNEIMRVQREREGTSRAERSRQADRAALSQRRPSVRTHPPALVCMALGQWRNHVHVRRVVLTRGGEWWGRAHACAV